MKPLIKNINSLRVRFALGFSILFTLFLAFVLIFIYFSFANFRKDEFYNRLRDKALTTFKLLIEVEQIDHHLLQVIDKNTLNNLSDEKVLIFKNSTLIYSSIDDRGISYLPALFLKAREKKQYFTTQGTNELVAIYLEQNGRSYTIFASAYDTYGRSKMIFLKWVMIAVYFSGLFIVWITTYLVVKKIIKPLDQLRQNLKRINYNSLDARLPENGQGEEVDSLSSDFNQMLSRLQKSFSFQKDFVHYASHELRTPLAAMVSLTENSMKKQMSFEQTCEVLEKLFQQQEHLTDITNSLLLLSDDKNSFEENKYPKIRVDELVFKAVEITKNIYPSTRIEVSLEGELSNENSLVIEANEPLMLMAFNNLLKNGLQYSSDNKVKIVVEINQTEKKIKFLNAGNPCNREEEEKIFTPFYRASNATKIKGYGLGLPLVKQIIDLHGASLFYSYSSGFNEFKVVFTA